jgi:hypothetical protein
MSTDELRICARRVLIAWDGTVLPKRRDETMFERMEDLRAALEAQPQPEHGGRPMTMRECMEAEETAQPEPVAWIDNLGRPQPHCVTDLKYCSVMQHELKEHLSYIPLYVSPPAPTTQEPEPDDYAALLRHAREILVKTGTVDVPYEQLGAGFLNVGIAPRLARDLRVRFHRDDVNARMVFGT